MAARPSASFAPTSWALPKKSVTTVERTTTRPRAPRTRETIALFTVRSSLRPAVPLERAVGEPEPQRDEGQVVDDVLQLDPPLHERGEVLGRAEAAGELLQRPLRADGEDRDEPEPEQDDERHERGDD